MKLLPNHFSELARAAGFNVQPAAQCPEQPKDLPQKEVMFTANMQQTPTISEAQAWSSPNCGPICRISTQRSLVVPQHLDLYSRHRETGTIGGMTPTKSPSGWRAAAQAGHRRALETDRRGRALGRRAARTATRQTVQPERVTAGWRWLVTAQPTCCADQIDSNKEGYVS